MIAPKILGQAMDVIFAGAIGRQHARRRPGGRRSSRDCAPQGQNDLADMLSKMNLVPGVGIDFPLLSRYILIVLPCTSWPRCSCGPQGWLLNRLVMRSSTGCASDIEHKLNRLPLNYFDTRQRGDLLSRVTNDVDNIQNALQQAFSQLVQSLLTVIGIVIMMFIVSWQLALIALIALPLSAVAAGVIGSRAQRLFTAQWKNTGALNGQIEESFSGHDLVRVFGRDKDMLDRFDEKNEELYKASFGAQFVSGMILPVMNFVSYLAYVGIAVVGGLRVASGR